MKILIVCTAMAVSVVLDSPAVATSDSPEAGSNVLGLKDDVVEVVAHGYRVDKLIGAKIHNEEGEKLD